MNSMDVVWLILDSLSFEATPFAQDGPDTMPQLEDLANKQGVVFTRAYSPGPTSPSSHGSFFTGQLPSKTGMHEATPYYSGKYQTIGQALSDTHDTFMISANPFIFNGLDVGVTQSDDLRLNNHMIFEDATNPRSVNTSELDSRLIVACKSVFQDGKPIRSFINGLSLLYHNQKRKSTLPRKAVEDEELYQYSNTMNNRIRDFLSSSSNDSFVIANYMDIHAPLDASDSAISKFSEKPRSELPIGVTGQEVYRRVREGDEQIGADMFDLYKATILDTDRKIIDFVRKLIKDGTFVVITADHGNWFRRDRNLEERRINVPLIIFSPSEEEHRTIDKTVNLRSLPRTTMQAVRGSSGGFEGVDLLSVTEDQISVTEFIHDTDADGSPVTPTGSADARYDFVLVKGDVRLDYIDGEFVPQRGSDSEIEELRHVGSELLDNSFASGDSNMDMSTQTHQHLKDLGYLD